MRQVDPGNAGVRFLDRSASVALSSASKPVEFCRSCMVTSGLFIPSPQPSVNPMSRVAAAAIRHALEIGFTGGYQYLQEQPGGDHAGTELRERERVPVLSAPAFWPAFGVPEEVLSMRFPREPPFAVFREAKWDVNVAWEKNNKNGTPVGAPYARGFGYGLGSGLGLRHGLSRTATLIRRLNEGEISTACGAKHKKNGPCEIFFLTPGHLLR